MKNKIFTTLLLLFSITLFSQTVSVTVIYTGAQARGCCNVCGTDYTCISNTGGCGNPASCLARTFFNPVPAGNIITAVNVTNFAVCGGSNPVSSVTTSINGVTIGTTGVQAGCNCGGCNNQVMSLSFACPNGLPSYNYGGNNTFTVCTNGDYCIQRAVITFTYQVCCVASTAPTSATASPNPSCGGSVTLTRNGGSLGTGAVYNWYTGSCGGTLIGSGSSITVSPTSTTQYFVRAQGTCGTTACVSVTVTLNTLSTAPTSASVSPNPICAGVSTTLTQSGGSLGTGAVYNWYTGSCGGTFVGTGSSISVSPSSTTTYYVRAQGTCNATVCAPVTANVNPVPFATASPSSLAICSGATTSIALSSFTPGTTFSWTVVESGVSGGSLGSGASIAQTLTTLGSTPGTATYTITPVATGCVGNAITVIVTVNPIPVATAAPTVQTICSGGTTSIPLTSTVSGTTFNWTVVQTGVSGATNSSGSTIAEVLTALGVTSGTAVYTITPTANGCSGAAITVTVTVDPSPVATATPLSQTICSGSAISIALTSNVSGTTFVWTVAQTGGVTGGTNGTGLVIADVLTSTTAGTAVYTITPTATNCAGSAITVTVTVNPMDDASFSYSSATYCQTGVDTFATITGLPGGIFSSTAGLVFLSTSSGLIDLSASTIGTYTITYTTNGICPNTSTVSVTITAAPATGFSYLGSPFCQFSSNPSPTFVPGAFAGTFSSTPTGLFFVNVNTGVVDLLTSAAGTYTIKNVIIGSGGCSSDSATTVVTVNATPIATATPSPDTICSGTATSIALTSSLPGTTYTWTVAETGVVGGGARKRSIH